MTRRLLAALSVLAVAFVVSAQDDITKKLDKDKIKTTGQKSTDFSPERIAAEQRQLKQEFLEFKQALLRLAQNLELSSKPEAKEQAAMLREALKHASETGADAKFNKLIETLRSPKVVKDLELVKEATEVNRELHKDLQTLIRILMSDNRAQMLRDERIRTERMLEQLKDIIRKQERLRSQVEQGRRASKDIAPEQEKVGNQTKDLIGLGKDNKGNEAKQGEGKGTGKEGKDTKDGTEGRGEGKKDTPEAKGDPKNADGKGDGKEGKQGEPKDGQGKEGDGKPGEPKDGKGDGKEGQPKDGKQGDGKEGSGKEGKEGKPGQGKDSQGKEGKQGDGKAGDGKEGQPKDGKGDDGKEGKPGEGKQGMGKEGKAGDGKQGMGKEGKAGEGKPGQPKEGKPGAGKGQPGKEGKPGQQAGKPGAGKEAGKPGENKQGAGKEGKPGDGKPGSGKEGKPGQSGAQPPKEGKPGDSKGKGDGKGEAKGEAKPGKPGMGGESKPSQGKPGEGKPGEGKPGQGGEGKPGQGGESKPGQQNQQEKTQARKRIEDASRHQDEAKKDLDKDEKDKASENQDKAIKDLKDAQKKLEELLRQIREEEIERLLGALQGRCEEMLKIQVQIYDGTVAVFNLAKANEGKLDRQHTQRSVELGNIEDEVVKLANLAIRLIEEEGSAIAFAEVFKQVRDDMDKVAKRLKSPDVGVITQNIERDIIETLKEMIEALKKARKENEQKKKQPPPKPGESGKPPEQDLIDLIAELKMIKSMQVRVNKRTEDYHKFYPGVEQVPDLSTVKKEEQKEVEMVQQELKNLADRQDNIKRITADISKGKNKTRD